jgi:hypothetical protein
MARSISQLVCEDKTMPTTTQRGKDALAGCIAVVLSVEADLQSLALDFLLDDRSEGGDAINLGGLPAPQFALQEGIVEGSVLHLLRRGA